MLGANQLDAVDAGQLADLEPDPLTPLTSLTVGHRMEMPPEDPTCHAHRGLGVGRLQPTDKMGALCRLRLDHCHSPL